MRCEECGGRMECFEGEWYCPDHLSFNIASDADADPVALDDAGDGGELVTVGADPDGGGE